MMKMGLLRRLRRIYKMNIKKFMVLSLVSLYACVGCGNAQESRSNSVEQQVNTEANETLGVEELQLAEAKETPQEAVPQVDPAVAKNETAKEQIQTLSSLIGKKAEEVDAILGEPANVQNLEDTDILLVRYYKLEYLDEIAKVEVVFNDHEQVVNYVSFVILKTDDITASKEILANALTELYGESTIERFVDKKGRQNRSWQDDTLTYKLTYYEDNISLDIYPADK